MVIKQQSQALNLGLLEPRQHPKFLPFGSQTFVFEQGQTDLQVSELFLSIQVKKSSRDFVINIPMRGTKTDSSGAPVLMVQDTKEEGVRPVN